MRIHDLLPCAMRSAACLTFLMGLCTPAWSDIYDIEKDLAKYGYLVQNDPSVQPVAIQPWACVPVATANSFVYLENMYPRAYNRKLVPEILPNGLIDTAEIGAVASTLASANYMNTKPAIGGTWQDMAIYGKYTYMEQVVPGVTVYGAQMSGTWAWLGRPPDETPPIPKPVWVQDNTFPTWQFLYENLVACEDVEICINDGDWGHSLTLTSFHWNDMNNDGIIDQNEGAFIDYIDPATGQWVANSPIWQGQGNNFLSVSYGQFPNAVLSMAMKESVPEPGTLAMVIAGGFLLALALRRRRRPS